MSAVADTHRLSPYQGLTNYTEHDAPFFFGRERESEVITANLEARRLTVLYGPSGVGKSSVLRAGVAARLLDRARADRTAVGNAEFVPVVFSAWSDKPLPALLEASRRAAAEFVSEPAALPRRRRLAEAFEAWSRLSDARFLVVLDQFEEYFLYPDTADDGASFATEFARAVGWAGLRASFLISIREDGLARLDRFQHTIPGLFDNYLRIGHLTRSAGREVIEEPLAVYNAMRTAGGRVSIQPGLVTAVLDQVARPGLPDSLVPNARVSLEDEPPVDTPYLQLVMQRVWDEEMRGGSRSLRLATLERLGGVRRIFSGHLDAALENLSEAERDTAIDMFGYLVTPSRTKIAHDVATLASWTKRPPEDIQTLVDKLTSGQARILRPAESPLGTREAKRYEIFHDVLAGAIFEWRERELLARDRREEQRREREQTERRLREWNVTAARGLGRRAPTLENVARNFIRGRVTPVLGPGASLAPAAAESGRAHEFGDAVPSPEELAAFLSDRFSLPRLARMGESESLAQVAQTIYALRGGAGPLYDELHEVFDRDWPITALHDFLAGLPGRLRVHERGKPPLIVTMYYDNLIERAFETRGEPHAVLVYMAEGQHEGLICNVASDGEITPLDPRSSEPDPDLCTVVLKLLGSVNRVDALTGDSYVITEDHCTELLRARLDHLLPRPVLSRLLNTHLLFLGYSIRDWFRRAILNTMWTLRLHDSDWWAVRQDNDGLEEFLWRQRHVEVLGMSLGDFVASLTGTMMDSLTPPETG